MIVLRTPKGWTAPKQVDGHHLEGFWRARIRCRWQKSRRTRRDSRRPSTRTIIYEMHVRGFTRQPNSGLPEKTRRTYRGVNDKIPYLQSLESRQWSSCPYFNSMRRIARAAS
jgi:pullulanase/glycogen debranching enzyme